MLINLTVRGLAVVETLDLELSGGLTVLSGETGAGKSILLDAIGLILGDRADSDAVRAGSERAEVTAEFDLSDRPEAAALLVEQELDDEGGCLIRRVVQNPGGRGSGRSRAFVNGRPVPLATLRELGEMLVDIHGQHEHQSLLRRAEQLAILDRHAGTSEDAATLAELYERVSSLEEQLASLRASEGDRDNRLDYLRFQLDELEALALGADEYPELSERHRRLANAGELLERLGLALTGLEDEDGIGDRLASLRARIAGVAGDDAELATPLDLLDSASAQIAEATSALRRYLDALDLDESALVELDRRMAAVHDLARKHRVEPEALAAHHAALREEFRALDGGGEALAELERELAAASGAYDRLAEQIGGARRTAAEALSVRITELMAELSMDGGRFAVAVAPLPDGQRRRSGRDEVSFEVSANPGQPLRPLAKVASGGELARISLAIQVAATADTAIPSLIFDEVDAGVGGAVAEIVGRRLRELGEDRQVLCVTHLPQVASRGHQHLAVRKAQVGEITSTSVEPLEGEARVAEIGRMLGGVEVTEATLAHAREMLG